MHNTDNQRPLKVAIYWDLRSTVPERHTGVGKHVIEVVSGLQKRRDFELKILLAKDQVPLWSAQSAAFGWKALPTVQLPFGNRIGRLLTAFGLTCGESAVQDCELVYAPCEIIPPFRSRLCVNTIHGIPCFERTLPERFYQSWTCRRERFKQAWFFRRTRKVCDATLVVSNYLAERLSQDFQFSSDRLYTVYNGADKAFFERVEGRKLEIDASRQNRIRLLQVGGANAFDGATNLLEIARLLEKHYPEAKLWIAGDRHELPWWQQLERMSNVVWLGFLSSERLLEEMRRSTALLYVPAVESFGIIGVEAMACGLPIIAIRSTALPEVLGDAAVWIDPADAGSLHRSIETACQSAKAREVLRDKGRDRAQQYTWPKVVERVASALRTSAA